MKVQQEFTVAQPAQSVWEFFNEPERVAGCMPGVEQVTVVDGDHVRVRLTQGLGPMTATFDATVTVLERVAGELIRFRATGRSVRGAIGNLRTENTVRLRAAPGGTTVAVDGDLVLAGALGSVGQKVVSRQAARVTAEFAGNLQRALDGQPGAAAAAGGQAGSGPEQAIAAGTAPAGLPAGRAGVAADAPGAVVAAGVPGAAVPAARADSRWGKAAVVLSGASVALSVYVLIRQRRWQ